MGLRKFGKHYYNDYGSYNTKTEAQRKAQKLRRQGKSARVVRAWNSRTGKFDRWQVWGHSK